MNGFAQIEVLMQAGFSLAVVDLCDKLLQKEAAQRPTMLAVMKHAWMDKNAKLDTGSSRNINKIRDAQRVKQ